MSKKINIPDLAIEVCKKVVAGAEETDNCGVCGLEDDKHETDCPYPEALEVLQALDIYEGDECDTTKNKNPIEFDSLIEKWLSFYGVDHLTFKLGKNLYEVKEDESDGYRSYFDEVISLSDDSKGIYSKSQLATVQIRVVSRDDPKRKQEEPPCVIDSGYELVDSDGHVWLSFGTDNEDNYYPNFVFDYTPKESK